MVKYGSFLTSTTNQDPNHFGIIMGITLDQPTALNQATILRRTTLMLENRLDAADETSVLNLSALELDKFTALRIASKLMENSSIRVLNLSFNPNLITKDSKRGLRAILRALRGNNTVEELNLRGLPLNESDIEALLRLIKHQPHIKHVDIAECNIDDDGAALIIAALQENTSLESLNISSNYFSNQSVIDLMGVLKNNRTLKILTMVQLETTLSENDDTRISVATAIADMLETNTHLQELNVNANNLGAEGFYRVVSALRRNRSLSALCIAGVCTDETYPAQRINRTQAERLALALKENTSLRTLDIGNNLYMRGALPLIIDGVTANTSIWNFSLFYILIDLFERDMFSVALTTLIRTNKTLRTLDLSFATFHDQEIVNLTDALAKNTTIETVILDQVRLSVVDIAHILEMMKSNLTITHLEMSDLNQISFDYIDQRFQMYLCRNQLLQTLLMLEENPSAYSSELLLEVLTMVLASIEQLEQDTKAHTITVNWEQFSKEINVAGLYKKLYDQALQVLARYGLRFETAACINSASIRNLVGQIQVLLDAFNKTAVPEVLSNHVALSLFNPAVSPNAESRNPTAALTEQRL